MPIFLINTNVKEVPAEFKKQAMEVVAKILGKPDAYVAVQVNAGQNLSFGGTDEPAALCDLCSIGCLSTELNKKHANVIMKFLEQQLNIKQSRIYINFNNLKKENVGYNGTTFDDLL